MNAPRVDADSDYAGCVLARKSTTCAHLFPWRQLAQSRKLDAGYALLECCRVGVLRRSQRRIDFAWRDGEDVGQCRTDWTPALSYAMVARTCVFWRDAHRKMKGKAQHGRHRHAVGDCNCTSKTFENVEDDMARWTSSAGVECRASALTA